MVITTDFATDITIEIPNVDMIRDIPPLGQTPNTTFLLASSDLVEDGVGILYISTNDALNVTVFTADLIRPKLMNFTFDLDKGQICLTFSEDIVFSSYNFSSLRLLGNQSLNGPVVIPSEADAFSPSGNTICLNLTLEDLNLIKAIPQIATSENSTLISVLEGIVIDPAVNLAEEIAPDSALPVTVFTRDITSPILLNFSLSLESSELVLMFSETIEAASFETREVAFQNSQSNATASYQLTGGSVGTVNSPTLKITLTASDINDIRSIGELATSIDDTFLVITEDTVTDTSGNPVMPILSSNALQAYSFNVDQANPNVLSFDFDANIGQLVLYFDEYVNVSSLKVAELTLQDSFLAMEANYSLTTAVRIDQDVITTINITLTADDLNAIKLLPLCSSTDDCYLTFTNDTISDGVGLPVEEIPNGNALGVSVYTEDTTAPVLMSFTSLNLETGVLSLSFTEAINVTSVRPDEIRLQTLFESPLQFYDLTNGTAEINTDGTMLNITLNAVDLNFLKRDPRLCTTRETCYFIATSIFLQDTSGNPFMAVEEEFPGYIVQDLVEDELGPVLYAFDFDLDMGLLTLHFNEPVDVESLEVTDLGFQATGNDTEDSVYFLTGGEILSGNVEDILIQLTDDDIIALKFSNATKDENTTFLSARVGYVSDTAFMANPAEAIPSTDALPVTSYTADTTAPVLLEYIINLRIETVSFTFDEPILTGTFNVSGLLLHSDASQSGNLRRLNDAEILTSENITTTITIQLSREDIAAVKLDENFGTSQSNTYLSIEAGAVIDLAMNGIEEIVDRMVTEIEEEVGVSFTSLTAYTLDLNTSHLILTFSDVVNTSTQYPPAIRLQSKITAVASEIYTLSHDSQSSSANGHIVDITLSLLDLLGINSIPGLAKNDSTTYLIMRADFVDDYQGNDVLPITDGKALRVATYIADTTSPELVEAVLDLNDGALNLTFSEPININTVVLSDIAIQNEENATNGTLSLVLTQGVTDVSFDALTITIKLNRDDVHQIRIQDSFGTDSSNSFVSLLAGSVQDFFTNGIVEVSPMDAFPITAIVPDMTGPLLLEFDLDLNTGVLNLTFSETINASTFNPAGITLQGAADSDDVSHTLTQGTPTNNHYFVTVQLSSVDLNPIKLLAIEGLGNAPEDTFISVSQITVEDLSGNPAASIPTSSALMVRNLVPDATPPELVSFILDLNVGALTLSFGEVVVSSSLDTTAISLQSSRMLTGLTEVIQLPSVPISLPNADIITVPLDRIVLNFIKNQSFLGKDENSTFITITESAIRDLSGNPIINITSNDALQSTLFIPDATPPVLTNFTLDLSRATVSLTFSEIVNGSTLNVTLITLQDSAVFPAVAYVLTTSSTMSEISEEIEIEFTLPDINAIKVAALGTDVSDTYLLPANGTIADVTGNFLIEPLLAIQADAVVTDTAPPELLSFVLDLNNTQIVLSFNEAVDLSSLNVSGLNHCSGKGCNRPQPGLSYLLVKEPWPLC